MDELVITIHDCLQCLRYIDQFTIADVLQEISEKRPNFHTNTIEQLPSVNWT
jgi:hypothetical protein